MIYCFSLGFLFCFCGISRQTKILINYSFLCFTTWLVNINNSRAAVFNMLATSKSCENICFFNKYQQAVKINLHKFQS